MSERLASSATKSKLVQQLTSPRFWIEAVCFFILATPFELEIGSGYGYAIKTACMLVLLAPRVVFGGATLGPSFIGVVLLAFLFLGINVLDVSQRAIFAFILIVVGAALGQLRSDEWNGRLLAVVDLYLAVHLIGFVIALLAFLIAGSVLDLHALLFPMSGRAGQIGLAARLSGFHNEPGTYAQWMLAVVLLRSLITGRIVSIITGLVGLTALLTVSLWAIVGVSLLAVAALLETFGQSKLNRGLRTAFSAVLLIIASLSVLALLPGSILAEATRFLATKAQLTTISGIDKVYALKSLQAKVSEIVILGEPLARPFCPSCLSPQDLGLWAGATYYLGLLPSLALAVFLALATTRSRGLAFIPLLLMIGLWKAHFYDPLLWVIVGYVLREAGRPPSIPSFTRTQPRRVAVR